jgi:hypothetical protein
MNVATASSSRTVLVVGAPRSGTTWLGKLLDSSPSVVYRHEPDMLIDPAPPPVFTHDPTPQECAQAAACIDAMVAARFFKTTGKMPIFRKSYRSPLAHGTYGLIIFALHALQKAAGDTRRMRRLLAPDLVARGRAADVTAVIKSISSLGNLNLLARARPDMRILLIVRDPFGQVASMLRGIALGKFERDVEPYECLDMPHASRYGLTPQSFTGMSRAEQHAWYWVLMNDKALSDLRDNPNAMVVCYNDLVRDPHAVSRAIFSFCALPVQQQTQEFIHASTHSLLPDSYYQVFKRSTDSLSKWRDQLTDDEQARIQAIASRSLAWQLHAGLRVAADQFAAA